MNIFLIWLVFFGRIEYVLLKVKFNFFGLIGIICERINKVVRVLGKCLFMISWMDFGVFRMIVFKNFWVVVDLVMLFRKMVMGFL